MNNIKKTKNLSNLSNESLLQLIFSNQLSILREIQFLKDNIEQIQHGKEKTSTIPSHDEFVSNAIDKCVTSHKRINEDLKNRWDNLSDEEKKGKTFITKNPGELGIF